MNSSIPRRPTYLMPTNFKFTGDLNTAVQTIHTILQKDPNINSEFNGIKWNILICDIKNGCITKCEINIFRDINTYIFECNKLKGENANEFRILFNKISNAVIGTNLTESPFSVLKVPDNMKTPINEEIANDMLSPIIEFMKNNNEYTKNMGFNLMCEVSYDNEMHPYVLQNNCISMLIDAIDSPNEYRLPAIIALTNLANNTKCAEEIRNHIKKMSIGFGDNSIDKFYEKYYNKLVASISV